MLVKPSFHPYSFNSPSRFLVAKACTKDGTSYRNSDIEYTLVNQLSALKFNRNIPDTLTVHALKRHSTSQTSIPRVPRTPFM